MENVFTWKWLRAALVRALKTVAQTAAATIGTAVMILSLIHISSTAAPARRCA